MISGVLHLMRAADMEGVNLHNIDLGMRRSRHSPDGFFGWFQSWTLTGI